ncbi:hypothetical protein [Sinosporangium siamense]|uniref:Secreted protein n=1 Tax=Sinosporangium siamense TaxID=1367973 RepID=A0A919RME8_9ACTN|nr:hypothetical protein [Sinosporangium siamense]GII95525.1 hypothetical protein Ssi02_57560 [Sinosporangium siamense]
MRKSLRAALVLSALAGVLTATAPASASAVNAGEQFHVCYKNSDCNMGFSTGTIAWSLPSALVNISGSVVNRRNSDYSTTVIFETFNDLGEKRTSDSRTVSDGAKRINFSPNAGHIWRIKITVCQNFPGVGQRCGTPENYSRR